MGINTQSHEVAFRFRHGRLLLVAVTGLRCLVPHPGVFISRPRVVQPDGVCDDHHAMVVLGGLGAHPGVILGAVLLARAA